VMHAGARLPVVREDAGLTAALAEMSGKGLGMTAVVDAQGKLSGVLTDGDLRRALAKDIDLRSVRVRELMTPNPRTVGAGDLAVQAVQIMEQHRINALLVMDEAKRPLGALNMHDLFRAGVV
jgi:arabinose-5-phosphate isomerase